MKDQDTYYKNKEYEDVRVMLEKLPKQTDKNDMTILFCSSFSSNLKAPHC